MAAHLAGAIKANTILKSSDGTVTLVGTFNNQQKLVFNANLDAEELNLGKILKNDKIGTLSFANAKKSKKKASKYARLLCERARARARARAPFA